MIKATFKLQEVGDVMATLELTMNVHSWKRLREQMRESKNFTSYPSWQVMELIYELTNQMEEKLQKETRKPSED